jgi:hypothetical protein
MIGVRWEPCGHETPGYIDDHSDPLACPFCDVDRLENLLEARDGRIAELDRKCSELDMEKSIQAASFAAQIERAESALREVAKLVPEFYRDELRTILAEYKMSGDAQKVSNSTS